MMQRLRLHLPVRRHAAGLSLVELLLATAITVVVGLAAAGMLSAASHGSGQRADLRAMTIKQELIAQRLAAAGRAARDVLVCEDDLLVLWRSDANNDGIPQVSEVRWIDFASTQRTITSTHVDFPTAMTLTQRQALDRDFDRNASRTSQLAGMDSYVVTETWASDVVQIQCVSSSASETRRPLLSYRVTLRDDHSREQTIIGAAALRSQ